MTDHTNTYPDLVNVEDWLNAKGYTGEAGACHKAMSRIRELENRVAQLESAIEIYKVNAKASAYLNNGLCDILNDVEADRDKMRELLMKLLIEKEHGEDFFCGGHG